MVQHLAVHGEQRVLDSASHLGMGAVVKRDYIPHQRVGTLSVDGAI
jgi:hypothetical protein